MGNSHEGDDRIDTYVHPRLGSIIRIQEANRDQFMGYELVIENQKVFEDWVGELKHVRKLQGVDEILFLPIEYDFKQTTYCGTGGMAMLKYEDYLYSLGSEIKNRREIKRPFNEQELLYLFYNLIKIEALLQGINRIIGDVRPENILVNEEGYAKIISQFSWPAQTNINSWQRDHQRLFLSPEECEERHKSRDALRTNLHRNQSEVFSIGVTVLEAGTLRDCSYVYGQAKEYKLSEGRVRQYLDVFQTRYSRQFSSLLKEMLQWNPRKRCRADRVYQTLKPYESKILSLEEVAIKLQNADYVPREREEKISIKKMGESHLKRGEQSNKLKCSEVNSSYRLSLQRGPNKGSQPQQKGSGYHSQQQVFAMCNQEQPSYQLIRENTNFLTVGRNTPLPRPSVQLRENMTYSLPVNLMNGDGASRSGAQYVIQHSMTLGRAVQSNFLREKRPTVIYKSHLQ